LGPDSEIIYDLIVGVGVVGVVYDPSDDGETYGSYVSWALFLKVVEEFQSCFLTFRVRVKGM
jgi:hypothetical protein